MFGIYETLVARLVEFSRDCSLDSVERLFILVERTAKGVRSELETLRSMDEWTLPPAIEGIHTFADLPKVTTVENAYLNLLDSLDVVQKHLRARIFVLNALASSSDSEDEFRTDDCERSNRGK